MGALVIVVITIFVIITIVRRCLLIKQSGGRRDSNNFGLIRVPAKIYIVSKYWQRYTFKKSVPFIKAVRRQWSSL